ncbi:sensor histidine kinase [Candidatus Tisiphia endosymbiont of Mystacides longicornis]|uniref:sensor histidine kinase n=3 Tax=unclassified Candidatus Tisiphia TaxID=2996318 RepID=UPI003CCA73F0
MTNNVKNQQEDVNEIDNIKQNLTGQGWYVTLAPTFATLIPTSDQSTNIMNSVGNYVDITKFKILELELQQVKNKLKESELIRLDLINNIGHSINTPCNGIFSLLTILHEVETEPDKKDYITTIVNCTQELLDYSNNMIEFLKSHVMPTAVISKKFHLKKLVEQSITKAQPAASHKGLRLACSFQYDMEDIILGDNYRLQAILDQLISNAIKFTEQGHVMITVNLFAAKTQEQDKDIQDARNVILEFIVNDTGISIPIDKQRYIYEKLTKLESRTKYRGLGLGLAFVKQFIEDLHGDIDVRSIEGKGTTFVCNVPVKLPLLDGMIYNEL